MKYIILSSNNGFFSEDYWMARYSGHCVRSLLFAGVNIGVWHGVGVNVNQDSHKKIYRP